MTKLMRGSWVGMALFALALTGCGKAKMDTQTALDTLKSVNAAQKNPTETQVDANASLADQANLIADQAAASSGDEIQFMGKPCKQISPSASSSTSGSMSFGKMEFGITGDQCPIEWHMTQDMSDPRHVKLNLHFSARTSDAKKVMDVDSMDLSTEMNPSDDGRSITVKTTMQAHSQSKGDVTVELNTQGQGTDRNNYQMQTTGTLTTGDKAADLKFNQTMKDGVMTQEAFINGDKLDENGVSTMAGTAPKNTTSASQSGSSSSSGGMSVSSIVQP